MRNTGRAVRTCWEASACRRAPSRHGGCPLMFGAESSNRCFRRRHRRVSPAPQGGFCWLISRMRARNWASTFEARRHDCSDPPAPAGAGRQRRYQRISRLPLRRYSARRQRSLAAAQSDRAMRGKRGRVRAAVHHDGAAGDEVEIRRTDELTMWSDLPPVTRRPERRTSIAAAL